ncbi:MAG: DUF2845 domain-containing protein [Pseudomonadota bacterium]
MAKKNSSSGGVILIVVFFALSAAYKWAQENMTVVIAILGMITIGIFLRVASNRSRKKNWIRHLHEKYNDDEIVVAILGSRFWKGQTEEQLEDSLGTPGGVDTQVLKTKTKEIWKYHEQRKGQFSLRITLENGKVVGWDKKD